MQRNRAVFAISYCHGQGLEIGALHHPFPLPQNCSVRYVDRMDEAALRKQYPELEGEKLVPIDIVDDGETLATIPDGVEDFVIASQFIEHCQNPIRALVNLLRVLKNNGFLILTIPDKRQTFDKYRPLTTNEHLLEECMHGTEKTKRDHYTEFVRLVKSSVPESKIDSTVDELIAINYSIHFHVWDPDAFFKFLLFTKETFKLPFEIFGSNMNGDELMVALRKVL